MQNALMAAYPWDLVDEGFDATLDRLQGEVGVSGLALHVAVGPVLEFRARPVEPRIVRTRGGLLFPPDESKYATTRCRAPIADAPYAKNALERIAEACNKRGLTLRLIASASRIGQLAARHPEFAVKNAFGATSEFSLCLLNPDVQAFLCGLVADLGSRQHVGELVIYEFAQRWSDADSAEFHWPGAKQDGFDLLSGFCFCESCHHRAAGARVDSVVAQRMVREAIDAAVSRTPDAEGERNRHAGVERINAYRAWQTAELRALLERMQAACPCRLREMAPASAMSDSSESILRVDRPADLVRAAPGEVSLSAVFLHSTPATELVSGVVGAAERGLVAVQFEHFGVLPDSTLTAIKQAIRFARRANL